MNETLKKLKLSQQNPVLILNAPEEYREVMKDIEGEVHTEIRGKYEFIQVFVKALSEIQAISRELVDALEEDGHLWVCYPKASSKKYKSDCKRDTVMVVFGPLNFEPVTLIALDEDWSAMRFKDPDKIKTLKRKTAVTEKAKERINKNTSREE